MKIGILSDTHGNVENAQRALQIMEQEGAKQLFHCGDITSSEVVHTFAGWKVTFVFGNMDHGQTKLRKAVNEIGGASIQMATTLELDGKRIAICHGHQEDILQQFIRGANDYVFHGHTHTRRDETIEGTRVINPGALGGMRKQSRSCCVLDLKHDKLTFIEL